MIPQMTVPKHTCGSTLASGRMNSFKNNLKYNPEVEVDGVARRNSKVKWYVLIFFFNVESPSSSTCFMAFTASK